MNEFAIIDLETTGLDTSGDSIIEVAAVRVKRGLIIDQYSTLIHSPVPPDDFIADLTGITPDMLMNQPTIEEAIGPLADFIGDSVICAHNAPFDRAFLSRYWQDQREWLDTLTLAQIVYPCLASYSLAWLSETFGIENPSAHRALSDALTTAQVFIHLKNKMKSLPEAARQDLLQLTFDDTNPLSQLIRQECALPGTASAESRRENKMPLCSAPNFVPQQNFQITAEEIASYLGENGRFAAALDHFEYRPQQLEMSVAVAEAFQKQQFLLAEAGTGTGKSLAYLLPAALFTAGSGNKVAISTHTKNLQEQLLHKDIPLLSQLLDRPLTAVLLKGRGNYLCKRLYRYLLKQPPENMRFFLMRIAVWQAATESGDGDELLLNGYDQNRWQMICASKDNCAIFCPLRKSGACYVQKSRMAANDSDIYILNHSLLTANAAMENAALPPFSYLIIDEAHHLEKAAEAQLTAAVDFYAMLNLFGRLQRHEKGKEVGCIHSLRQACDNIFLGETNKELLLRQIDTLESGLACCMAAAEEFFSLTQQVFSADAARQSYVPAAVRLLPAHYRQESWPLLQDKGSALQRELSVLAQSLFRLQEDIHASAMEEDADRTPLPGTGELPGLTAQIQEIAATIERCLANDQENYVVWLRFSDGEKKPSWHIAPIELANILQDCLFSRCDSVVLTSATMATGASFSFFKRRLGLDLLPIPPREMILPSPFFYREQALFTVVNDLPDWSKTSEILAVEAISASLLQLLSASRGRALVLFTSHQQLQAVYRQIRRPLLRQGIQVLAHGVNGGPVQLLHRLQHEPCCAILGTNSFWEGVDVAGDALSLLVIVRLPFNPPNNPLNAAKSAKLEAAGHSSFAEYSLPQAILRFKQGFGRLIRSGEDCGLFCVLDRRIVDKQYGKRFIEALPPMERRLGSSQDVAAWIREWLN